MKIVEKKFKRNGTWWEKVGSLFHTDELSQAFDIPEGVRKIWLSLHDQPGVNRVVGKAELVSQFENTYPRFVSHEFPHEIEWTDETMDKILEPLIGKTLHLQCEYEI